MKRLLLILFGFIPLAIGWVMNWLIMSFPNKVFPYALISIVFLALWALLGFIVFNFNETIKISLCLVHIPIFLALVLNLYQEIILGQYFGNLLGVCTQIFYLPILNISYTLTAWSARMWTAYIVGFVLITASFFVGYTIKSNTRK